MAAFLPFALLQGPRGTGWRTRLASVPCLPCQAPPFPLCPRCALLRTPSTHLIRICPPHAVLPASGLLLDPVTSSPPPPSRYLPSRPIPSFPHGAAGLPCQWPLTKQKHAVQACGANMRYTRTSMADLSRPCAFFSSSSSWRVFLVGGWGGGHETAQVAIELTEGPKGRVWAENSMQRLMGPREVRQASSCSAPSSRRMGAPCLAGHSPGAPPLPAPSLRYPLPPLPALGLLPLRCRTLRTAATSRPRAASCCSSS